MAKIVNARAYANNEVAFVAWETDPGFIPGCLGFDVVRERLDDAGAVIEARSLAAYVAFTGQSNPDWLPQNTAVWPVQKYNWRDLTLRRRRDKLGVRVENEIIRYAIRAVGRFADGMEEVVPASETHFDPATNSRVPNVYLGNPLKLGYLTAAVRTNNVTVTRQRGQFTSTFTNGILSSQYLIRVLEEDDGKIGDGELSQRLKNPDDKTRRYLAGDVLSTIRQFFGRQGGTFHAALYELEDDELLGILERAAPRLRLILSDAGGKKPVFDTRNEEARKHLRELADKSGASFTMQDRLFNGSGHIGHNKFVVWSNGAGQPQAVLTGSTNWTWSGVCGQSNNLVVIDEPAVAQAFKDYWQRLHDDPQPVPAATSDSNPNANQSDALKLADRTPVITALNGGGSAELWFSPNMPGKKQPPAAKAKPSAPPPDMARLFSLMRRANEMIMFAVFLPAKAGRNSIISEAINLGLKDSSLQVIGAISDPMAWGHKGDTDATGGKRITSDSPFIIREGGINVVRATALTDKEVGSGLGDFVTTEILTTGKAIIHDKILVIDPLDPVNCVVAFGSHNLGYKASYSNDENLVIVKGHADLALAYAVHVLDVYDHYRFRAAEAEQAAERVRKGLPKKDPLKGGFLNRQDIWQNTASRIISAYFAR
jgi:phosphatidylserine/phosphatidylglycerophosphate/cardiolipin synthase-like enzyme